MASSGEGLASVIASMILTRPDAFIDLLTMLKRIIPQIKNIRVAKKKLTRMECETLSFRGKSVETSIPRSVIGDCLIFDFENAADVAAFNVSVGTLMVLGLLTALHCSSRPRVVLVDDIEKGLHPDAQRELVGLLREILSKEPELQIIATSHSPYFLDFLQFDEVRLTVLDEKGHTVCGRLENHPKYEKWKMELAPGEMWSLFAEKWMTEGAK